MTRRGTRRGGAARASAVGALLSLLVLACPPVSSAQGEEGLRPQVLLPLVLRGLDDGLGDGHEPRHGLYEVASLRLPGGPERIAMEHALALHGNLAYVAYYEEIASRAWIEVVDLSDPYRPALAGRSKPFELHREAHNNASLAIAEGTLYVGATEAGVQIFSLEDPFAPKEVNQIRVPNDVIDLAVVDDRLFVLETSISDLGPREARNSLWIYDIQQRERPRMVTETELRGFGSPRNDSTVPYYESIVIERGVAYLASTSYGLHAYAISPSEAVEHVWPAFFGPDRRCRSGPCAMAIGCGRLLLSNHGAPRFREAGLFDFEIADATSPTLSRVLPLGEEDEFVSLSYLATDDRWAYVVDRRGEDGSPGAGLHAIDLADGALRPDAFAAAEVSNDWAVFALAARDGWVYVLEERSLRVYAHQAAQQDPDPKCAPARWALR